MSNETALTKIPEYSATAVALADLRSRMANVVHDVATTKGMAAAKKDVSELRGLWVALEAERVRIKAPALERSRLIDAEAKTLEAELKGLADPIKAQIEAEENRKEREKAERERLEAEAVAALNARFEAIRALPLVANGKTLDFIDAKIAEAEATDPEGFPERVRPALAYETKLAIAGLRAARDQRVADDAAAEKNRADLAELDRLRAEKAQAEATKERELAAERARVQAEADAKAAAEAQERAAAKAEADRQRREQEAAERAERKAERARQQAEADRLAAERAQLERDKKAAAKKAREQEIENATMHQAAAEAITLLHSLGQAEHIATKKLEAAIRRTGLSQAA